MVPGWTAGVAAFLVFIHHFLLAFYTSYYTFDHTTSHLNGQDVRYGKSVYSVLSNGNFYVCVFFVLSGFVLSRKYFQSHDLSTLISGAQRRFIRLYVPVAATLVLAYFLIQAHAYKASDAARIANSGFWLGDPIFPDLLKYLLLSLSYKTMLEGSNLLDTTMWSISVELYGSLFVFAFLALTHNTRCRVSMLSFVLLYAIFAKQVFLAAFVLGISLNYAEQVKQLANRNFISYLAIVLSVAGLVLGSFPSTFQIEGTLYEGLTGWEFLFQWIHTAGAFFLVLACALYSGLQRLFSVRPFRFLGYISYSFYLLHPLIIYSVGCRLFLGVYGHLGYHSTVIVVFLGTTAAGIVFSYLMTKCIDGPGIRLAKYIYERWVKKAPVAVVIQSS